MNTKQAESESAIERLEKNLAKRDKDNLRWTIATIFATGLLIIAIVRLP